MKKGILLTITILCLAFVIASAQAIPQGMNYQAVARDNNGDILKNQSLNIRVTIMDTGIVWQETHNVSTNAFGLFTLVVGQGTTTGLGLAADFGKVDWKSGPHTMQIEMDLGSGFVDMGTSPLQAVPYAMVSGTTTDTLWMSVDSQTAYTERKWVGIGHKTPAANLHIVGNDTLGAVIIAPGETGTGDDSKLLFAEDHDATYGMYFRYDGGGNKLQLFGKSNTTVFGPHLTINRDNGAVGVGAGTTSPSYNLEVRGGESSYLGYFYNDNNNSGGNAYSIYSRGDAYGTGTGTGIGARFYGYGGSTSGPAYGSIHNAYAYGSSSSYAVYADADGGSTTGREYAFYGIGDGYFSGNVGIGTSTPNYTLHLEPGDNDRGIYSNHDHTASGTTYGLYIDLDNTYTGSATTYGAWLDAYKSGATNSSVYGSNNRGRNYQTGTSLRYTYGSYGYAYVSSTNGTSNSYGVLGTTSGNGDNEYAVYASGDLAYTGSLVAVSDAQLKSDEQPLSSALNRIMKLQPKAYTFKQDRQYAHMNLAEGQQYGFLAQELEQVFPEMIHTIAQPPAEVEKEDGTIETVGEGMEFKGVDYTSLIPVLVKAIQEQQAQIEALQKKIDQLQQQK